MKDKLIKFIKNEIKNNDINSLLEVPKMKIQGDFSLPMFFLAKEKQKSPQIIAKEFEEKLNNNLPDFLEKIVSIGPYLNFYFNSNQIIEKVILNIKDKSLFKIKSTNSKKILIEYPSPNTNKSLHIGHVRNILLGNSLSKILNKVGHKIIRTNLNNNRGIAVCKSMLGYKLFFLNETPQSLKIKSDEFVSKCYVKFCNEAKKNDKLNDDSQKMLLLWENNNKDILKLWNKILNWVFEGYSETYKNYKLPKFDMEYFESNIYDKGKYLVLNALKNNVNGFKKSSDGAIYCDFEDETYGKKYLLRGDGTTLYMTQDLYLASLKEKKFNADKYIFIVGCEQEYHFQVLFKLLERMNISNSKKNFHFSYGMVYDKFGKPFSSRLGNVISADEILKLVIDKSKKNLLNKELTKNLNKRELNRRAKIIGYCALAFSFLKPNPTDDIKFDLDKSLSFDSESGPYVQYTYARIQSIFRKSNYKNNNKNQIDYSLFDENEINLIKLLGEFPNIVIDASNKYKISIIANYLIKVSQLFNEFYQNKNIMKSDKNLMNARLELCFCVSIIIKEGLELCDIEVLNEM